MRSRSSRSCGDVSRVDIDPPSFNDHTVPACTRSGTTVPVARSLGSRTPDRATIGVPVVPDAAEESVSVAASSSRTCVTREITGCPHCSPVSGIELVRCTIGTKSRARSRPWRTSPSLRTR